MHGFLRKPVTSAMLQDAIDRTMVALRGSTSANAEQAQL